MEGVVEGCVVGWKMQDSGTGIPQRDRTRVFDRFYRVPGTGPSGSGLGLAIVKAVADRHGATVELGDAALGGLAVKVIFSAISAAQLPSAPVALA